MAPHDFLDEQWDQTDETAPRRPHRPYTPPRQPQGGRGRIGGVVLALGIVVILVATAITLWTPQERTPTPVEVANPTEENTADEDSEAPQPEETTPAADAPPAAQPAVDQIITRWATRESADDDSWSDELTGKIAPDTLRRITVLTCLPVQSAPLRVDSLTPAGEPTQSGTTWSGDLTVTVTDTDGAQTPVTVRAQAAWNEPTTTWMLTGLECLASGGSL
ncbi:hypothetical protein [uncultured Brachybacterium sp.]|uniref:hypothetical protein n=1 Tax=uncultured Brachybacterium sp. TaxID=189680 RepID=UPI002612F86A|nr:hypothetical protein [uncultured Brachybacterium sp.]